MRSNQEIDSMTVNSKRYGLEKMLITLGALLVAACLSYMFWQDAASLPVTMLFAAGMILVIGLLYRHAESGGREDERIRKAVAFAGLNSWLSAMLLLMGLVSLIAIGSLTRLSTLRLAVLVTFMMLLLFAGWYSFYAIRGDTE